MSSSIGASGVVAAALIEGGPKALPQDASRSGRTPSVTPEVESCIVETTLNDKPPGACQIFCVRGIA